jgi:hypothetical protein
MTDESRPPLASLPGQGWLRWHFHIASALLLLSAPLYLLRPGVTVLFGASTAAAAAKTVHMWMRGRGAVDLALGALALRSSFGESTTMQCVASQPVSAFAVVDMGAFRYSHGNQLAGCVVGFIGGRRCRLVRPSVAAQGHQEALNNRPSTVLCVCVL